MKRIVHKGFTLIELLVVIAIIGTLVTLLLPKLTEARRKARIVKCRHNLKGLGVAVEMYLHTSGDIMPAAAQLPSEGISDYPPIGVVLADCLDGTELLRCPADKMGFYEREGSSYEYHTLVSGEEAGESFLSPEWGDATTPVMNDYWHFHGPEGQDGSTNFLFADGHVGHLASQ